MSSSDTREVWPARGLLSTLTKSSAMVRENQILVQADDSYFACLPCGERLFSSEEHLFQHCRTARKHQGKWCDYHEWLFVSSDALRAHEHNASDHWICDFCNADEDTERDLIDHMGNNHSHCYDCSINVGNFHKHRVDDHSRCDSCSNEFEDQNKRDMVSIRMYKRRRILMLLAYSSSSASLERMLWLSANVQE